MSTQGDGSIKVDFAPDMYVVPVVEDEPSESNPDVKVTLGKIGGKISPISATYPPGTTIEEMMGKVDLLFSKIEYCPNCERKKRIMLEKLKRHLEQQGKGEVFDKVMSQMAAKKEAETQLEQQQRQELIEHKVESSRPTRRPLEERMNENVMKAANDVYVAIRNFAVPPIPPVRPDAWLEQVGIRRRQPAR